MFEINGIKWDVYKVPAYSDMLRRSDNSYTVGMCDFQNRSIFLCDKLKGQFLRKVIAHELVHCFMMSYSIHIPIEEEEFIADWVSLYGTDLIMILDDIMAIMVKRGVA